MKAIAKKGLMLLVIVSLLCGSVSTPVQVSAKTTEKNWYKEVVNSDVGTYKAPFIGTDYTKKNSDGMKTVQRMNFKKYALLDIDQDGTKELFCPMVYLVLVL